MLAEAIKNIYGWSFDELIRNQKFKEIYEEIQRLERENRYTELRDLAENLKNMPSNIDTLYLVILGKNLEKLLRNNGGV